MSHAQDYYANYAGLSVADYVERFVRGSSQEMARMARTAALLPPDVQSVLDIGAGHGVFLEQLQASRGIRGVGIEITPAKVEYARSRGVDLRLGDAARLDFADQAFDAVVVCEVLEHLPFGTYEAALRECARVARQWVLVTVPYDERRRFVQCPYCSARVNPDYHFRAFAPGALHGLVPGFQLQQSWPLGRKPASLLLDLGRRWVRRWPAFLTCPACGFQPPAPAASRTEQAQTPAAGRFELARRIALRLAVRHRPIWLVGLYHRERAGA